MPVERNIDSLKSLKSIYYEKGELACFESLLPYINRQTYKYIDINGELNKRKMNLVPLLFLYINKENADTFLEIIYEKFIWKKEKRNIKELKRLTKEKKEDLEENLYKTLLKNNQEYSLQRAYELFKRDKDSFFNVLKRVSLIDDTLNKTFLINIAEELIKKNSDYGKSEALVYFLVSFIAEESSSTYLYERALSESKKNDINILYEKYKDEINKSLKLTYYFNILKSFIERNTDFNIKTLIYKTELYLESMKSSELEFEYEELFL